MAANLPELPLGAQRRTGLYPQYIWLLMRPVVEIAVRKALCDQGVPQKGPSQGTVRRGPNLLDRVEEMRRVPTSRRGADALRPSQFAFLYIVHTFPLRRPPYM